MHGSADNLDQDALLAHARWLERLARAVIRDPELRGDALQETWCAALSSGVARRDVRGWLAGRLRGALSHRLRAERRRGARELCGGVAEVAPAAADVAVQAEERRRLAAAVRGLDEPFRTAIVLRYFRGLEPSEIAAATAANAATVRSRIRRGVERLRADLALAERAPARAARALVLLGGSGMKVYAAVAAALVVAVAGVWIGARTPRPASEPAAAAGSAEVAAAPQSPAGGGSGSEAAGVAGALDPERRVAEAAGSAPAVAAPAAAALPVQTTLYGRVREVATGAPVAGAELAFAPAAGARVLATCDERGEFRAVVEFGGGRLRYSVRAPGAPAVERIVDLEAGGERELEVGIDRLVEIRAIALDAATGAAVPGALARVAADLLLQPVELARADAEGRLRFRAQPSLAGRISFTVEADGYALTSQPVDVLNGAPDLVRVELVREFSVEGRVLDGAGAPAAGAQIKLDFGGFDAWSGSGPRIRARAYSTKTGADGAFRLRGLPPDRICVLKALREGERVLASRPVEVSGRAGETARVELRFSAGAGVATGLLTFNGRPYPIPYEYTAVDAKGSGKAGPDGRYRIDGLAPGGFQIRAMVPGITSAALDGIVPEGSGELVLDVALAAEHSPLAGIVVGPDGAPVAGQAVQLNRVTEKGAIYLSGVLTDAAGAFRTTLPVPAATPLLLRLPRGAGVEDRTAEAGREDLRIEIGAIGLLRVRVVDAGTGAPVANPDLQWRRTGSDGFSRIQGTAKRPVESGSVELLVPAGACEVRASESTLGYGGIALAAVAVAGPWSGPPLEIPVARVPVGLLALEIVEDPALPLLEACSIRWRFSGGGEYLGVDSSAARGNSTYLLPQGKLDLEFTPMFGKGEKVEVAGVEIGDPARPAVLKSRPFRS